LRSIFTKKYFYLMRESGRAAPARGILAVYMPSPKSDRAAEVSIPNGMSVDVEDYFHTEAMATVISRSMWEQMPCRVEWNTEQLFELFAAHGVYATFFFLGWVAKKYPRLVLQAKHLGHEIACHSYWHRPIYTLSPAEFREDTRRAKGVIEDAAGIPVLGYRAPSFSLTPGTEWAADILAEAGFAYDSSVHPIGHDLYDNRGAPRHPHRLGRTSLIEIPISTVQVGKKNLPFCGGGYFRILPYAYTRWALQRVNFVEKQSAVFYIHPWEIDPGQPRLRTNSRSKFRQYFGLAQTLRLLRRLLQEFSFAPMSKVFSEYIAFERR
jgi:polysaccharide deacetylase family protein (PEP-CTERM system associated)